MKKIKAFLKKWGFFLIVPLIFILTFDYRMIQPSIVERPANSIYDPNHRLNQDTEDKLLKFNRDNISEIVKNVPSEDLLGMSGAIILVVFMAIVNYPSLHFIKREALLG